MKSSKGAMAGSPFMKDGMRKGSADGLQPTILNWPTACHLDQGWLQEGRNGMPPFPGHCPSLVP